MPGALPPAPLSSFVGRSRELAALAAQVDSHRLVSVVGPGGAGKTRLAVHWLGLASPEVIAFVDLGPLADPELLPATVARAAGLRDDPGVDPLEQLCQRLLDSTGVVVLDTCEHLRAAVAQLAGDVLGRCPALHLLVTSRVALDVPGEAVLPLGGLGEEAVALFVDRARLAQPAGGEKDGECARAICVLADGLPLAVELAAAHARALALPDILAGMSDRLRFLTAPARRQGSRHSSMAASIRWSYELVDPGARHLLCVLSVLPGRFTLEAAGGLLGVSASRALEVLVEHSLVQFDPADGRYALLDTIREFGYRELGERGERAAAEDRLFDWAVRLVEHAEPGLDRADEAALRRVERDGDGLRAALETALRTGRRLDVAARIVTALTFSWSLRGHCLEGRMWADRVLAALDDPPCGLLWSAAFLAGYAADVPPSSELARRAADTALRGGDLGTLSRALIVVGMNEMFGAPGSTLPTLREAADLARRAGDRWARVEALQMLAYAHLMRSEHREVLQAVDDAVVPLDELDHPQLRAWDAAIRAGAAVLVGQFGVAEAFGQQAVSWATAVGEPISAADALRQLVTALCQLGRVDECSAVLDAQAPFFVEHPGMASREMVGVAAATAAVWRDPGAAVDAARAALADAECSGMASLVGEARLLLAVAELACGNPEQAREVATSTVADADAIEAVASACAARLIWCAAQRVLGAADDLAATAHRALADAARNGFLPLVADALDVIAGLDVELRRDQVAARLQAAADRVRAELGCVPSPLISRCRAADIAAVVERLGLAELVAAQEEGARLDAHAAAAYAARSRGRRGRPRSGWASLTATERDVVALIATGLSNPQIAARMFISEGTVRTHLRSVFAKVGVRSRAELAAQAARRDR